MSGLFHGDRAAGQPDHEQAEVGAQSWPMSKT